MTELKEEDFDFEHDVEIAIKKESGIVIPARRKQKDKQIREAPQMSPRRQQNKTTSKVRFRSAGQLSFARTYSSRFF